MTTGLQDAERKNRCALCGCSQINILYNLPAFNIMKCERCNFMFNDKWDSFSEETTMATREKTDALNSQRDFEAEKEVYRDRFLRELAEISRLKKTGRLLDIGCACGYFLRVAQDTGWQAYGIDIDKNAVEYGRNKYALNLKYGVLNYGQYPEKYFDVVTLFHALEHMPDFEKVISIIKTILKDNGLLVIDVPNVNDLRRRLFGRDWPMFRQEHLWYFSKHTLQLLLERYGFKIIKTRLHGGSNIAFKLDKVTHRAATEFIAKHFRYIRHFKHIFRRIYNLLGFNEDILVYAKNINH
ncbi:MAG: class I SAM-dependent methyltransferase [Candidatus Omnitrophica bacterium]|nr:class I SAM-dependent methyltransferase [Candidatus Omnitrophota bacterium]